MPDQHIGNVIFKLRKEKGITQQELAVQINKTRKTISSWETGATTPAMADLVRLAQLFGKEAGYLAFYDLEAEAARNKMKYNIDGQEVDFNQSAGEYAKLLQEQPDHKKAKLGYADLLYIRGMRLIHQAKEIGDELFADKELSKEFSLYEFQVLYTRALGELDELIARYTGELQKEKLSLNYEKLIFALMLTKRWDEAMEIATAFKTQLPKELAASYWLGKVYFRRQEWEQATLCLEDFLRQMTYQTRTEYVFNAYFSLRNICLGRADWKGAIKFQERAIEECTKRGTDRSILQKWKQELAKLQDEQKKAERNETKQKS